MDIDTPTLLISEVAERTGFNLKLLRSWVDRDSLNLGTRSGPIRRLSMREAYAVAVTIRLVQHSLPVSRASTAARSALAQYDQAEGELFMVLYTLDDPDETAALTLTVIGRDRLASLFMEGGEEVRTVVNVSAIIASFDQESDR